MIKYLLTFQLALFLYLAPGFAIAKMHDLPQVTILATSSFSEPITELARIYSKEKNIIVTASFDGTAEQARKIEQGEQADIFISSHPLWMSALKQKGLVDVYSLTNLVRNKLALISSANSKLNSSAITDKSFSYMLNYFNKRSIMVMGDFEESALGLYTKQTIQNTDASEGRNLWKELRNRIIPSPNSKNALYLIAHGETAGIVYYSDAYKNKEVNIISVVDDTKHDPIIYQGAVVAGENMSQARDFLIFLQSAQAKEVYKKYGLAVD